MVREENGNVNSCAVIAREIVVQIVIQESLHRREMSMTREIQILQNIVVVER